MDVKKGRKYRCIRNVYMNGNPNDIRYIKGKIYRSEIDGCITDEMYVKGHIWREFDNVAEPTFTQVSNKKKNWK